MYLKYLFLGMTATLSILAFNNCQNSLPTTTNNSIAGTNTLTPSSGTNDIYSAPDVYCNANVGFRLNIANKAQPKSIKDFVDLVNALPKPLTIPCLVSVLKGPLSIYAIDNIFSAQPSAGFTSPRIFIINTPLIISVVPDGSGKNNIELSEITSLYKSVKGDLLFPIENTLSVDEVFNRILVPTLNGSQCVGCHGGENRNLGTYKDYMAYETGLLTPNDQQRVPTNQLLFFKQQCSGQNDYRCQMLKAFYNNGYPVDVTFPVSPNN